MTQVPESSADRRRGNRLGFWFFRTALRCTGLRGAYGLLYFVCAHYALFDRTAAAAADAYLSRRFDKRGPLRRRWDVYRLFIEQGKNLIDRNAMLHGAVEFDISLTGGEHVEPFMNAERGFVLLTSHTGNWQTVMACLKKWNKPVYLLMRPEQNAAVRDALQVDSGEEQVHVIDPDQHLGGVVQMLKAIDSGGIVSIMGDRTYGADSLEINFLGDRARMPYSAFQIAASARVPVAILLSGKTGPTAYNVEIADCFEPKLDRKQDRKAQLTIYVQRYADALERYLQKHPWQYFVFRDIWSPAA